MVMRKFCAAALLVLLAGCAGPVRRPEPQPDLGARVSAFAADTIQGGHFAHLPGGMPDGGVGMTHTAGAVGSPAGAGNATGAATTAIGASAIIIGNVAIVGVDPQIWPALSPTVLQSVRTRSLSQFPQLADVRIVTQPEQVARVARLQRQMQAGTPATSLMDEIRTVVGATE